MFGSSPLGFYSWPLSSSSLDCQYRYNSGILPSNFRFMFSFWWIWSSLTCWPGFYFHQCQSHWWLVLRFFCPGKQSCSASDSCVFQLRYLWVNSTRVSVGDYLRDRYSVSEYIHWSILISEEQFCLCYGSELWAFALSSLTNHWISVLKLTSPAGFRWRNCFRAFLAVCLWMFSQPDRRNYWWCECLLHSHLGIFWSPFVCGPTLGNYLSSLSFGDSAYRLQTSWPCTFSSIHPLFQSVCDQQFSEAQWSSCLSDVFRALSCQCRCYHSLVWVFHLRSLPDHSWIWLMLCLGLVCYDYDASNLNLPIECCWSATGMCLDSCWPQYLHPLTVTLVSLVAWRKSHLTRSAEQWHVSSRTHQRAESDRCCGWGQHWWVSHQSCSGETWSPHRSQV